MKSSKDKDRFLFIEYGDKGVPKTEPTKAKPSILYLALVTKCK